MITELQSRCATDFRLPSEQRPWEWAAAEVDYGRASNYETPFRDRFDADLMPFWKQPLEDMCRVDIREVVVVKCSRAGGSENFLLTRLRYAVARQPEPALYMTDSIENAESFMEDRIKRGMRLADVTWHAFNQARVTEHMIRFPAMDLRLWWAKAKGAYKQTGYALILSDEVSTWPVFGPDQIRKRADMYPFHHIAFISSPDPARKGNPENDPILVLYRDTNRQEWVMPDPEKPSRRLTFRFGGADTPHGLKWPADAKVGDEWDLDRIRKETHYVTESGTVITNDQREDLMRAGEWRATAESRRTDIVGYKIVAPMIPTHAGDFGELAARFLSAKHHLRPDATKKDMQHNPLRVYFAEYWGEAHREEQVQVHDDTLAECREPYKQGEVYVSAGFEDGIYFTVDVQKYHLWWLARVWGVKKGNGEIETALLDWGNVAGFTDLDAKARDFSPGMTGIDIGYRNRASEVADYCAQYTPQRRPHDTRVFALFGSDTLIKAVTEITVRDALEGRRQKGSALYCEVAWNADVFRTWQVEMMDGARIPWRIPENIGDTREGKDYLDQVTSTRKIDGAWVPPRHGQDHLFDCECEQLVLARFDNLIQ